MPPARFGPAVMHSRRSPSTARAARLAFALVAAGALAALAAHHAPAAAAASAGATPTAVPPARLGAAIDAWARPLVEAGHLSGQLLVARRGAVILERQFGWANAELRVPVTAETRFCVASITKPMTIRIAFRLMEQQRIGYRDSIARWLPDFPAADTITIEHLLRHRSGIPHEIVPDSDAVLPRTAAEMVELAKRRPLDFRPGSKYAYSTGGFTVLARILEIASGKSYGELLEEHVFGPAGMTHSSNPTSIELLPGRAAGYLPGARGLENAPFQDFSGLVGGGSVWSTARDVHRFVDAVVTGRLGESERASWLRNGRLDFNGSVPGFRAYAEYDSASGLEVTFVGNVTSGAPDLLRAAVKELAAGRAAVPASVPRPTAVTLPEERLERYHGAFQLESGVRLVMRSRGGLLYANDWVLVPTGEDTFFSPRDYGVIRGVEGPDGRIARLDWTQRGQVYPAPRVGD